MNSQDEKDYHESEDEDYDPTKEQATDNAEDGNEGGSEVRFDAIESASGGLVKTRFQREEESRRRKDRKSRDSKGKATVDIDSLFADMKKESLTPAPEDEPKEETATVVKEVSKELPSEQKIKIKRTYEFAGEVVTEEKWVDVNSEEARAQLNSTKLKAEVEQPKVEKRSADPTKPKPRKRRKRPGLLEAVINGSSAAKISTLEKSRLDWANYVDKKKISDELKYKNKAGYLDNQDFLSRVDNRQDSLNRDARNSARKQQSDHQQQKNQQ